MWVWRSIQYKWYAIEERLKSSPIRNQINGNPKFVIGLSAASSVLLLLIVITSLTASGPGVTREREKAWFYDLNTQQLFAAAGDDVPPIDAPSGALTDGQPAGVRAYVFSRVSEPNESERFIGYLEMFTPEGKEMISTIRKSGTKVTSDVIRQLNRNRLLRRPSDTNWFPADSNDGRVVLEQFSTTDGSKQTLFDCSPE